MHLWDTRVREHGQSPPPLSGSASSTTLPASASGLSRTTRQGSRGQRVQHPALRTWRHASALAESLTPQDVLEP
eukprot:scaffold237_cov421-Prasinococcus_capsulatus_cf.AAC.24